MLTLSRILLVASRAGGSRERQRLMGLKVQRIWNALT